MIYTFILSFNLRIVTCICLLMRKVCFDLILETELLEHLFLTAEVLWQVESRAFWQVETWAFSTSIISCETSSRDNQLAIFLSACFCLSVSFVWFFIKSQTDFHYILKLFSFSAAYRSHIKMFQLLKKSLLWVIINMHIWAIVPGPAIMETITPIWSDQTWALVKLTPNLWAIWSNFSGRFQFCMSSIIGNSISYWNLLLNFK